MYYIVKVVKGENTYFSYQDNQYGSHFAWNTENIIKYENEEKAKRIADSLAGKIKVMKF